MHFMTVNPVFQKDYPALKALFEKTILMKLLQFVWVMIKTKNWYKYCTQHRVPNPK